MDSIKIYSQWHIAPTQRQLLKPLKKILAKVPPLKSKSSKPLAMNTEELINILTYYHLQEFTSGTELIQALQEDDYADNLLPLLVELNTQLSLIPLMTAGLNNFLMCLPSYSNIRQEFCRPSIPSSVILLP